MALIQHGLAKAESRLASPAAWLGLADIGKDAPGLAGGAGIYYQQLQTFLNEISRRSPSGTAGTTAPARGATLRRSLL